MRCGGRQHTEEQIVCVRTRAPDFEYLDHVEELAMDITHDRDRRPDVHDVTLFHEQFLRLGAYCLDDRLGQQLLLIEP